MAALTWRNVDAPDFRGVQSGVRDSTAMFSNALDSLSKGLTDFRKTGIENSDRELAAQLSQIQDPEQLKAFLTGGGAARTGASAEAIANAGTRVSDLLKQSTQQQGLDVGKYAFDRTKTLDTNTDAGRQLMAAIQQSDGKRETINGLIAQNPQAFANLQMDQQGGLMDAGRKIYTNDLNNQGKVLSNTGQGLTNQGIGLSNQGKVIANESGRFALNNAKEDRQSDFVANNLIRNIAQSSGTNEDVVSQLASMDDVESPALLRAMGGLQKMGFNVAGPIGSASAPAAGGRRTGAAGATGTAPDGSALTAKIAGEDLPYGEETAAATRDAQMDIAGRSAQEAGRVGSTAAQLSDLWTKNKLDQGAILGEVTKKFPGIAADEVLQKMNNLARKHNLTPAQAGAAVVEGMDGGGLTNLFTLNGGWDLNDSRADNAAKFITTPDAQNYVSNEATRQSAASRLDAAEKAVQAQRTAFTQYAARASVSTGADGKSKLASGLERERAKLEAAQKARDDLIEAARGNPNLRTEFKGNGTPPPASNPSPVNGPVGTDEVARRRMLEKLDGRQYVQQIR